MAENTKPEKPTLTGLARRLGQLPADKKRAALETSAALAGVSLRVSREFVEAVPKAAKVLSTDDLRNWGEFGRRLAMGNADSGVKFFADGVDGLKKIPKAARAAVFHVCSRQLVLSSSIALQTFHLIPGIAADLADKRLLASILNLAVEIAQRSAKHSADFLEHTPAVARAIEQFGDDSPAVADAVLTLAADFVSRTGGLTADLWQELPTALAVITAPNAVALMESSAEFLEYGGSVTLHFVASGSKVLTLSERAFDDWRAASREIARHGNAVLIAFLRATPKLVDRLAGPKSRLEQGTVNRVLLLTKRIAETDAESALAAFKSSAAALQKVSVEQFEEWVESGLRENVDESTKARRSYFALETRASNERLQKVRLGLSLESIQPVLRMYIEALTGKEVEIVPLNAFGAETRIGDGKTIHLPSSIAEFDDDEMDFRLYKVLAAHGAGQIEFGTFDRDTLELKAAFTDLSELYSMTAEERDSFSLDGYLGDPGQNRLRERAVSLPKDSDYRAVLKTFPEPRLARKIFGTMENARIDHRLRHTYRGLVKDLDLMRTHLGSNRPYIFDLPIHQVPSELLFQITLCGGATEDAKRFYGQIVSEIESVIETYFHSTFDIRNSSLPTVADSLMATSRIYTLFQNITPEQSQESETDSTEEKSDFAYDDKDAAESVTDDRSQREQQKQMQDIRDLFNAWNSLDDEGEPDDLQGAEAWSQSEVPEQALEADDLAFAYDEWDRELNDYRVGWSRVIEKKVKNGDRNFVELARSRYRGVISSIRHQFQLMKPENLTRINREIDGEDYDLNALVDFVVDRKADGLQSENIYTKRLRKQRDVAVSLLLDQSSSTARTITRNPMQPYTHPGRRIIEIEKEGIVLMSEALEAVGDVYSINGFTSEGRRNVKFYVVKDFNEKYSDEIEKRIGGITFQNNTRLGAAIRHAAAKLLRQESRTKLLIILTDGRPYDHDYGDARYAREDVREALTEAKMSGITPFCITVDRESEAELKDLYGDVGYTIIDDVLSLPERMPNIYRRLTS
ncbi:MAG TPA: VWA domain-containing protein [Pyrinomonadaceae bacterium]|nr:VWA domain-containing protein [Pyrinomonadaceae bacterium]